MVHINGRPDAPVGYFHDPADSSKTGTAVRSSYKPSLADRITNRFSRQNHPRLAGFAHSVRSFGLARREKALQRQAVGARERFEAVERSDQASAEQLRGAAAPLLDLEHAQRRIGDKQTLAEAALEGKLEASLPMMTELLQQDLRDQGMAPLQGLRATPHNSAPSRYLVSQEDGHRIKINAEKPPLLARMIANSVSAGYDRGSSGAGRAIRSAMQHALVGVYSAEQSIKGMAAGRLARSERLDAGARARMEVRAARSGQKRTMLQAALSGNEALNSAYGSVLGQQVEAGQARLERWGEHSYDVRESTGGVKPPQTRFIERRVDAYFQRAEGEQPSPSARAIARFAIGLSNVRAKMAQTYHAQAARRAPESARHAAALDKAQYNVAARRSILHGRLIDMLGEDKMRTRMDLSFPEPGDGLARDPGSAREDGDDVREK